MKERGNHGHMRTASRTHRKPLLCSTRDGGSTATCSVSSAPSPLTLEMQNIGQTSHKNWKTHEKYQLRLDHLTTTKWPVCRKSRRQLALTGLHSSPPGAAASRRLTSQPRRGCFVTGDWQEDGYTRHLYGCRNSPGPELDNLVQLREVFVENIP